jgi:tRNA (guanine-N7-)-methyltransferase
LSESSGKNFERSHALRRKIRSFVKRESRMSRRQTSAIERLFPIYGIPFNNEFLNFEILFQRQADTVLEIGFGMGDSLVQMASDSPELNYIGIEVHRPGVGSLLASVEENQINNIRVINHDAVEVLQQVIPDQSLDAIQIFFPDPWPKKKHHKRRLIKASFVELLTKKINSNGRLHIATDWKDYAEWIEKIMKNNSTFAKLPENTLHNRSITKFEKRGIDLGHGVWDMIYAKKE